MRDLNYQLKQLCRRNRDGSFATQRDRARVLDLVANQLQEAGFRHLGATSLKPKHVEGLVARWQAEGLAVGTIKNRMAELRWWAEKIGKSNVIARDNHHYGIGNLRIPAERDSAIGSIPSGIRPAGKTSRSRCRGRDWLRSRRTSPRLLREIRRRLFLRFRGPIPTPVA
jgi:hypothetical protein